MEQVQNNHKQECTRIPEVDILRPILIFFVVLYHTFAVYDGKWCAFDGYAPNEYYKLISRLFSFRLEALVFISGMVWGYRRLILGINTTFLRLIISKFKRLLIPSFLFSIIYVLAFEPAKDGYFLTIVMGAGHLWFLPMLFTCFVLCYWLIDINIRVWCKLLILFMLALISFVPLPFNISKVLYYLLFFYGGYVVNLYNTSDIESNIRNISFFWGINILIWLFLYFLVENLYCHKVWYHLLINLTKIMYSVSGVVAVLLSAHAIVKRMFVPVVVAKLCSYCFGVYLFHQFILQFLYYRTKLFTFTGTFALPWYALTIALMVSLILIHCVRLSRFGRYLIR